MRQTRRCITTNAKIYRDKSEDVPRQTKKLISIRYKKLTPSKKNQKMAFQNKLLIRRLRGILFVFLLNLVNNWRVKLLRKTVFSYNTAIPTAVIFIYSIALLLHINQRDCVNISQYLLVQS